MRQIRGVKGEAVVSLLRAPGNTDAAGVKPKAIAYHRLSRRVNKMKIISLF
jgi:hypothetical protein